MHGLTATHRWHFDVDAYRPTSAVTSIVKGEKKRKQQIPLIGNTHAFTDSGSFLNVSGVFLVHKAWRLTGFFNIGYVGGEISA